MKLLHLFLELSTFAFHTLHCFSLEHRGNGVSQASQHQSIESGLNLRGRKGAIDDEIDSSSQESDLFLTEENARVYAFAIGKYLSTGGCLHGSKDPQLPRRNMYQRCAVVGASPNSHGSKAGAAIDSHDAVLRAGICDASVLQNYSKDIGVKTTYCVSFSEKSNMAAGVRWFLPLNAWNFLRNVQPGSSVASSCAKRLLISHPLLVRHWENVVDEVEQQGAQLPLAPSAESGETPVHSWRALSTYLDPECLAQGKGSSCPSILAFSSGFEAVLFARDLCDKVDVYGFDTDERTEAAYGHLHENVTTKAAPCVVGLHSHPFPLERRLLKLWDSQGKINLAGAASTRTKAELGHHTSQDTLQEERSRLP